MNKELSSQVSRLPISFSGTASSKYQSLGQYTDKAGKEYAVSRYWLDLAIQEARVDSWHHIRREIIFSVAFLDAFLHEWIQIQQLNDLEQYVANEMFSGSKATDNYAYLYHAQLEYLLDLKQGMVDVNSVHYTLTNEKYIPQHSKPGLTPEQDLLLIPNGWAIGVALDFIQALHTQTDTQTPDFVRKAKFKAIMLEH